MFGNLVGVEDLVQDSFLRAYLDLARLRDAASFGAWVRGIAVNLARMELRSGRLHLSWEDLSSPPRGSQPSPETLAEGRMRRLPVAA
jgi:DNA-directed RNA polymerase specialized sigma24 family protein